ncbi:MAG: SAM-dependent chlorinase/fluorinase [Planctomycetes bacterium]|nr:SAM-dependent chlorinase/fluorinase [Planctomycetota bacterium]
MKEPGIITLLTDFGLHEPYVGVMKGVILGICPEACIVDLTHQVEAREVMEANFALHGAFPYFPAGTIHVVVVDPGVGSSRRILCARSRGMTFLAPDNGVLTGVFQPGDEIRAVTNGRMFLGGPISHTFHGRDIFAPVAARLLAGARFADVGGPVSDPVTLDLPQPVRQRSGSLMGTIIHIDQFGNLISNIRKHDVEALPENARVVSFRGQEIGRLVESYASVERGAPLAIVDSFGFLEIAVNSGSAAKHFNGARGDPLHLGLRCE